MDPQELYRMALSMRRAGIPEEQINNYIYTKSDEKFTSIVDVTEDIAGQGRIEAAQIEDELNDTPFGRIGGVLSSFGQGASFGFADELSGVASALGAALPGGRDIGEMGAAYEEGRDVARGQQARFKEENPWLARGAEFAGGLAGSVLMPYGRAAGTAPTLAKYGGKAATTRLGGAAARGGQAVGRGVTERAGRFAGTKAGKAVTGGPARRLGLLGAGEGALYGAGASEGESIGELLTDAAVGGAAGGLFGMGIGGIGNAWKGLRGAKRTGRRVPGEVAEDLTPSEVAAREAEAPYRDPVNEYDVPEQTVRSRAQAGIGGARGTEAVLEEATQMSARAADSGLPAGILGDTAEGRQVLRYAAEVASPGRKGQAGRFLAERAKKIISAVRGSLDRMGGRVGRLQRADETVELIRGAQKGFDDLAETTDIIATPRQRSDLGRPSTPTTRAADELESFMNRNPLAKEFADDAAEVARITPDSPMPTRLFDADGVRNENPLDFKTLQLMIQSAERKIQSVMRQKGWASAAPYAEFKRGLQSRVFELIPEYSGKNIRWREVLRDSEALQAGTRGLRAGLAPEDMVREIDDLIEAAGGGAAISKRIRESYGIGLLSGIRNKMGQAVEGADVTRDFRRPNVVEKLKALFPEAKVNQLMQDMADLEQQAITARALQGTDTAGKALFAESLGEDVMQMVTQRAAESVSQPVLAGGRGIASVLQRLMKKRLTGQRTAIADELMENLLSESPEKWGGLLMGPTRTPEPYLPGGPYRRRAVGLLGGEVADYRNQ